MADETLSVRLLLDPGPDADDAELELATARLRAELAPLDLDSVELARGGPLPAGAKGDPVTIGALVVALSASGGVFVTMLDAVRDWLSRQAGGHKVTITMGGDTLVLDGATAAEQRLVVEAFAARHSVA